MAVVLQDGGAVTPPCSPMDSPPPAPAPAAPSYYISSLRASSRRGGGVSPDKEKDPVTKLLRFLKTFYRELASRDPANYPPWAPPLPTGTTCPATFEPYLQLVPTSARGDGESKDQIRLDQIFSAVRVSCLNYMYKLYVTKS